MRTPPVGRKTKVSAMPRDRAAGRRRTRSSQIDCSNTEPRASATNRSTLRTGIYNRRHWGIPVDCHVHGHLSHHADPECPRPLEINISCKCRPGSASDRACPTDQLQFIASHEVAFEANSVAQ